MKNLSHTLFRLMLSLFYIMSTLNADAATALSTDNLNALYPFSNDFVIIPAENYGFSSSVKTSSNTLYPTATTNKDFGWEGGSRSTSNNKVTVNGKTYSTLKIYNDDYLVFKVKASAGKSVRIRYYYYNSGKVPALLKTGSESSSLDSITCNTTTSDKTTISEYTYTNRNSEAKETIFWLTGDGGESQLGYVEVTFGTKSGDVFTPDQPITLETTSIDIDWSASTDYNKTLPNSYVEKYSAKYQYQYGDALAITEGNISLDAYHAVAFKLKVGTAKISFTSGGDLFLVKGGSYAYSYNSDYSTLTDWTRVAANAVLYLENDAETIYWLTGGSSASTLTSFSIEYLEPTAPSLVAIDSDYLWYFRSGGLYSGYGDGNTYYTKSATGSDVTTYGSNNEITINGKTFNTYGLSNSGNKAVGFKVKKGTKGIINIYTPSGVTPTLSSGLIFSEKETITTTNTTKESSKCSIYKFDLTEESSDVTYWIETNNLGGFEVLFDNSSVSGNPSTIGGGTHYIYDKINSALKNKNIRADGNNIDDTDYFILPSGTTQNNHYVFGPSLPYNVGKIINEKSSVALSTNVSNAVGIKLPANRRVTFKFYMTGESGSGIKLKEGSVSGTDRAVVTYDGSTTKYSVAYFDTGENDATYWIVGNSAAYAYFVGFDLTIDEIPLSGPLLTIDKYHLWRAEKDNMDRNSYQDVNYLRYNNSSETGKNYITTDKVSVLGIPTQSYSFSTNDQLLVKVDQSKGNGLIRVYYDVPEGSERAKEYDLSSRGWDADWGGTWDSSTKTITVSKQWQGRAIWLNAMDLSDYDYVEVKLSEALPVNIRLGAQYTIGFNADGSRNTYDDDYAEIDNNVTTFKYKLNKMYKACTTQIFIQNREAISESKEIKISSVTLYKVNESTGEVVEIYNVGGSCTEASYVNSGSPTSVSYSNTSDSWIAQTTFSKAAETNYYRIQPTANISIAGVEVLYTDPISHYSKNVEWYVNKDTKLIVGSQDYLTDAEKNVYGEKAEFYVSKGRKATFAFWMPSITQLFYQNPGVNVNTSENNYYVSVTNGGKVTDKVFRNDAFKADGSVNGDILKENGSDRPFYSWYTETWEVNPKSPTIKLVAHDIDPDTWGDGPDKGTSRTWTVELTFVYLDEPTITATGNSTSSSEATITIEKSTSYPDYPVYYTNDATDPANLASEFISLEERYSTKEYTTSTEEKVSHDCIYCAAQYVKTDKPFYTDGVGSEISQCFKLVSDDKLINLSKPNNIIYVTAPNSSGTATFSRTAGDIDKLLAQTGGQNLLSVMYGTTNAHYYRSYDSDNVFYNGGVKWDASKGSQDGGYDTYMDPYTTRLAGDIDDGCKNANPSTECNDGLGGANTENGGKFLAPMSGDFIRIEPEFDGVATLWIRQNGMSEVSTMVDGKLARRPVFIMDENGVIMRGSTIKPTALHHLSINGAFAVGSGRNQLRQDFAQSWRFGTYKSDGWKKVYNKITDLNYYPDNYRVISLWFDVLNADASVSGGNYTIWNSFNDVNPFNRIGTQPLYRDDWLYNKEMSIMDKGAKNLFAKYGYELPNFAYVRYRIPVKAGKTYYIGGRGTKNGFVAAQFEPLDCNYDNLDYRRADNPSVIEDPYKETRSYLDWNFSFAQTEKTYNIENALKTYGVKTDGTATSDGSTINTYIINEKESTTLPTSLINGKPWWESFSKKVRGNNKIGTTVNVKLVRTFENGKWYPIVLPFSVSESRMKEIFGDGVKVIYLDPKANSIKDGSYDYYSSYKPAVTGAKLSFTCHYYQMLYANMPAFICPSNMNTKYYKTEEGLKVVYFNRVTVEDSTVDTYDIGGGYQVTGSYTPTSGTDNGEMYYISNMGDKVCVYHSKDGIDMKGTRVWVNKIPSSPAPEHTGAPMLRTVGFSTFDGEELDVDNASSGIQDIVMDDTVVEMFNDDNVYDMLGRIVGHGSLDGMPKGVYIFKGQKQYVR